jgi:ketose-bisphosphate aldolase
MLVSPKVLLADAKKNCYAIGAFNFYNLDTLLSILTAAEEEQSPVIVQIYSSHYLHYNGGNIIAQAALAAINASSAPIALHLDHCTSYECILKTIQCGFNSVMYDGSALSLEKNIAITTKVAETAHHLGVYTEAEIGRIFRAGSYTEDSGTEYSKVEDAVELVAKTGVDSLAPAVGTTHGMYKKEPEIHFELIEAIAQATGVPLVLHGGSGIPDEMIAKSIACGVCKINVGTELKYKWSETIFQNQKNGEKEPIDLSSQAIKAVQEIVRRKIQLFGSGKKSNDIYKSLFEYKGKPQDSTLSL